MSIFKFSLCSISSCFFKAPGSVLITLVVSLLSIGHASAANRIFNLHIKNGTDVPQGFWLGGSAEGCYEGTGADSPGGFFSIPNLAPGESFTVTLARTQGNECDGSQGYFSLRPFSYPKFNDATNLQFDNAGGLAFNAQLPNNYHAVLSEKSLLDESYTWTMLPIEQRLKQPIDQRLTRPRNHITTNIGEWDFGTPNARGFFVNIDPEDPSLDSKLRHETLVFDSAGFAGNSYEECFGSPFFHPQHVQRLDDKDGKAYFMVAQSRAHNGSIYLVESFPGVLDESTGRLDPNIVTPIGGFVGKIIWEQVFTGGFNGSINPIGNWNHPGKMMVIDGVLTVAAQNWSEGINVDTCSGSTSNPYQRGDSEDAVLFFDVRDPSAPQYWGKMTATELQIPRSAYANGGPTSPTEAAGNRHGRDGMISVVSLWRTAEGKYAMNVGGRRNGTDHYATWETDAISPNIESWTKRQVHEYTSGEYGDDFESYQAVEFGLFGDVFTDGMTRNVSFETTNAGAGAGEKDGFIFQPILSEINPIEVQQFNLGLNDDNSWIATSHHATREGIPLVYTVFNSGGSLPVLIQVYDVRNSLELPHIPRVVNSRRDSAPGSLREAIGYGGTITFDESLDGTVLILQDGPLMVSRYDVDIDATSLPHGVVISGGFRSRVLHVTEGNRASLRGVTIRNGVSKSQVLAPGVASNHSVLGGGGILNEGTLLLSQSTLMNNISENDGGGIFNSGTLEIQNSTITGNYSAARISSNNIGSVENNGNTGGGGGISNIGVAQLVHTTVAGNTDFGLGIGGIKTLGEGLLIDNSIIAANSPSNQGNLSGSYSTLGANIVNSNAGALRIDGPVPIEVPNLELQPLDNYGGRTPIMPPLDNNSPVVDSAQPTTHTAGIASEDQNGNLRPIGAAYDIGAVEAPAVAIIIESISTDQSGFASGAISISPEPRRIQGVDYFQSGALVTLTAEPNSQSEFVSWGGSASVASCGTSLTCNVTIVEGLDVQVTFQPKPLLSIDHQGIGEISLSPAGDGCPDSSNIVCQRYSTGTATLLTATAGVNSEFNHWEGDCLDSGVTNVASITMNGNKNCTAVFNKTHYQLTVASRLNTSVVSDPAGEIDCGDDCTETYLTSDGLNTVILTASVDPGFVFVRWYGDTDCYDEDEGDGDPLRIRLTLGETDANVSCSAVSVLQGTEFALTVEKIGAGVGIVTAEATPLADSTDIDCAFAACSQKYSVNSVIQLTATPDRGSLFKGWNGDPDCTDGQVTMSSNITCSANFTSDLLLIDGSSFFGSLRTEFEGMLVNTPVGGDFDYWSVQSPNSSGTANSTDPVTLQKREEPVAVDLETYSRVIWYTGNATSSPVAGPSPTAEAALGDYLDNGGCFLLSSSEYFTERGLTPFAEEYLGVSLITDNVGSDAYIAQWNGSE